MVEEQEEEQNVKLMGIDDISMFLEGKAYNTLIAYKKTHNLPMFKIGGSWQAYVEDIEEWISFQEQGRFFEDKHIPSRKKKKRARIKAART